ncbi:MAG: cytochrome c3 family protein [Desulfobacterales bacterium]|nr:cytochrome c3 family protein [Desulfobacterales bacterium]MCP4161707.1 cytochrome c3 family protein [Deltaproteobacteria bacterium]
MKKYLLLFIAIVYCGVVFAEPTGPEKITITGKKRGPVVLDHRKHQKITSTCLTCHSNFPKETNGLKAAISKDEIKKKFVMNKVCIKCHRSLKKTGKKHGPTACNKCHQKKKKKRS